MSANKENTPEEVDLGQLFKMIGEVLNRMFLFIQNFLNNILHLVILFLQFIRIHFLKFVIVAIIGLASGWYLDYILDDVYESNMVVEPNFNSVQQLYNNIEFYNDLATEEEFLSLANALAIKPELAETIRKFEIESFSDQTQKIKQFSDFIQSLDTISQKKVDYEDYLKNFNNINAPFHKITIEAINPTVAKKCQKAIIAAIEANDYFKLQKKINDLNLSVQDSILSNQISEIDSLQRFLKQIKVIEANKAESNTSINLGDGKTDGNIEIELLKQASSLKLEIVKLNKDKAKTENTINLISEFPEKGVKVNDFFRKKKFLLPIMLIALVFVVLSLLSLNKYLKNYQK